MRNKLLKNLGATFFSLALSSASLTSLGASNYYQRSRRGGYSGNKQYLADPGLAPFSSINFPGVQKTAGSVGGMDAETDVDFHFEKGQKIKELLIVDGAVQNKSVFLSQDRPGVDIIEIESGKSGIVQLLATLTRYRNLEAVHVISHATSGKLQLGNDVIDAKTFEENVSALAALNGAIKSGGDLLFYGCELAKGAEGERFLEVVKGDYDFDIAASNDLTGNDAEKANWDLEIQTGDIEATPLPESIASKDFTGTLQFSGTIDFSQIKNTGDYNISGGSKDDAEFYTSASMEYTLYTSGSYYGTGAYSGALYTGNTGGTVTMNFDGSATFNATSIYIKAYNAGPYNFNISSNLGSIVTNYSVSNAGATIALSTNNTGITHLYVSYAGGDVSGGAFYIDNLVVANVSSGGGDTTPPEVTSIVRQSPMDATTNATSATFRVTFDEDVTNVSTDGSDFTISGAGAGGTATITGASAVTGSTVFDVTVGSINTDGLLDLGFAGGQDIQDLATNAFGGTNNGTEETYTIDQTGATTSVPDLATTSDTGNEDFTSGSTSDNLTNDRTPTFTGSTEIGASVSVISTNGGTLGAAVVDGSGNWTFTPSSDIATGAHDVTAQATDALGNVGAVSGILSITIDNTAPTVSITSTSSPGPTNDNPIPITITFNEEAENLKENEIAITGTANGTTGDYASADSTTFTVNVTPGNDGTVLVDLAAGAAFDLAGNSSPTATQLSITYDGTAPTISSSTPADNATGVAVADDITITFNENIQFGTGFFEIRQSSDDAALFSINAADPTATTNVASISGATLTINPGASLAAGTGYYVFILSGTPILDLAGNPFSGLNNGTDLNFTTFAPNNEPSFSLPGSPNQTVSQNAGAQTVNAFATSISDGDGDTQTLTFNVSNDNNGIFSAQPDVDETTGNLTFTPMSSTFGKATVTVSLSDNGGTSGGGDDQSPNQTFDIFVTPDNIKINEVHAAAGTDLEFIEVYNTDASATSLSGLVMVWFNGGDDLAYKDFDLTGSTNASGFYLIGETNYTAVTPDQTWGADGLQNGPDAVAIYVGSSSDFTGSSAGTTDGLVDIIVYGSSDDAALRASLGNPSLDVAGDASNSISREPDGTGTFVAQSVSPGATNDVTAPTVTNVTSSTTNGSFMAGDMISIQVVFSEDLTVTGTPQLTLETGATDRTVNYASGSGTATLTFTYTVQAGDESADLDYVATNSLALNSGTIADGAGNNATLTLATPGAAGSLGANKALVIDGVVPTVTNVTSSTANGTFGVGEMISIQTVFSEAVTVTGTPQLTLETGATDRTVNYASGSGTATLTFTYTVQAGDESADLDYVATNSLALNSGTIADGAGNDATLTLATPGAAGSLGANKALVIDGVVPTVTNVTSSTANGTYGVGDAISIQAVFSEAVTVTGTPQLTLETGATDRTVNYASGSGSTTLTFTYTVQAGDESADLDYVATNSLALNSGTIADGAGNNATLTLATPGAAGSLGANKALVIDGVVPTVTNVTSSTANGTYGVGDAISIQAVFSEAVTVTGTPQLTLETGATDRTVNYVSGSGTTTLTFTYTVQAGDESADLDYAATNSLALNSGTINDGAGNAATLTLATPGAAGSLGANKDLVIDTAAPTGYSVGILQTPINSGNETAVSFAFASAEVGATYNYTLSSTGGGTNVTGSGTITTATDLISGIDVSGLGDGTITLSVTLTDAAGNTGTAATDTETKDTVAPSGYTITIDQSPINSGNAGSVSFTFAGAEIGADYSYTVTTSGGAATLTSGGTIVTSTDQVTIPGGLSGFQDGTITVSVTLEDVNSNTGIAATDTETKDVVAPTISSSSPSDGATSVARDGDITLTFNEDISLGTGNVTVVDIGNTANNVVIDVTSSGGQLSVSGAILTINPTANLALDTEYAIQVDATAIMDAYANAYAGISNTTTLNFTTDDPSLAYGPSGATLSPTPSSAGSFSYFASQGGQEGLGFTLSTDGQKAYMVNSGSVDKLFEYSLSTPFDISTATATTNISIAAQNTNPQGVTMSADGSKIYMVGASKVIYQYTLNTPFDLSAGVSVTSQSFSGGGDVRDVFIGPNGQNIYTIDRDRRVAGWTLGTAYDISTLSSNGAFSVTGFGSNQTQGLAISNDGTKLFVSALGKTIREYEMSTPFSIGTASATGNTFSTSSGSSFPSAVYLTAKGDNMYVANVGFSNGTGNNVNQYSIEVAGFTEVAGNDGSVSGSIEVTVTDALFNNAGGTFTHTTDYTVTNLPAGFTPAMNVSGDGLVATLTLTGNATAHENVDDLADLSFTFQNSAFNGFDASEVANAVSANSGFGIDFDNETDPPVISSSTPADDATTYPTADNLTITFNEDIQFGNGNITIQDLDAPSTFVTIDVTSPGSQASISGGVLTINPTSDLAEVTNYAIQIDNTAITDLVDNAFAGISDNTTLNFLSADETPPTITITTPIETDDQVNSTEDGDVTISGTTSGAEDGQTVTVTLSDGNNPDVQVTGTVSSDAWTASDADISGLDNGNITVTADVDDQAGNSAIQASETITLDNMAPTIAITTPIEGDDIANAAEDNDVTVTGTTSGAEDGQTVTVTFNDGTNPTIQVTGTVSSNAWTASDADISGLDNGNITVTADVDDAVGNSATQSSETIILDQTAPTTASFTRKTPTASTTNADMVTYLATFSEDVTGVDMNDFIATGVSGTDIAVSQVTAATYDVTVSGGDMANFNGAMALNFNSPSITDLAGNALPNTEPATDDIYTLDNTAPTITISTPIEGDDLVETAESSDVEVSGTTTGVEDGQSVTVAFNDGANTPVSVNATVTSNAWSITATDISGLNDGSVTVTADISDVAGNAATQASETITLDQAPPTISSTSPADDATNVDIESDLTITFNENIQFNTGNIQLIDLDDNSGDITIDASSPGSAASISGAVLTIANPSGFLEESVNYVVQIASTAIQDVGGNAFAGIADNTTLNFTTEAAPTISIADATVTEGNSGTVNATFTISLDKTSPKTITLDYATSDNTATTADSDYTTVSTTTLTFNPSETSHDVTVAVNGDTRDEDNETFFVDGTNPTNASFADNQGEGTITDDDDAPTVAFTSTTSNGAESTSSADITVELSTATSRTVTVDYALTGTATGSGTDYTLADGTITFAADDVSETVTIGSIVDDAILETDETVILTLSSPTNATLGTNTIHTYTITNNDNAAVTIADASVSEDGTSVTVTATLDNQVQGGFDITVTSADGTASATNGDYTAVSETLTFAGTASETQTFTVSVTDDAIVEADENLTLSMGSLSTSAAVDISDGATVTITNDDSATITIADVSQNEGTGDVTVTLTLDEVVDGGVSVDVSTADGTATTGDGDYTALSSETVTFTGTSGETQTVTIAVTDDSKVEADETISVSQGNASASTVDASNVDVTDGATVTLTNDDVAAVTLEDISGDEDSGVITVTATLDNPVDGGFTVEVSTADGTAESDDYTSVTSETLTFAGTAGEAQTFTVTPTSDERVEGEETVSISMANLGSTTLSVTITDDGTVTITENDATTLTFSDESVDENGGTVTVTATLEHAVEGGFTVPVSSTDGTAGSSDYTTVSETLTFAGTAGETQTFEVAITDDAIVETNETLTVSFGSLSTTADIDNSDEGTVTIVDEDNAVVTVADVSQAEGDGNVTVTLTLDAVVAAGLTVDVSTADGSATTTDSDYTALESETITFTGTSGETQTVTISVTDDSKVESDETLTVSLGNLTSTVSSTALDITDGATVTLTNDDAAAVTIADASGAEEGGAITLTATLDNPVDGGFIVEVSTTDETAASATDYTAIEGQTLTFAGTTGETQTFTVTPSSDEAVEADETVTVSMGNLGGTTLAVTISDEATVTITNDDNAPVITANQTFPIEGILSAGDVVGTAVATDADEGTTFSAWTIVAGNTDDAFAIAGGTGVITVNDPSVIDLIATPSYTLTLTVGDGTNTSAQETVTIEVGDGIAPTVTLSSDVGAVTNVAPITVTATFSELVLGFALEDLTLTNATASNLAANDAQTIYTFDLTPDAEGNVSVSMAAGVVTDAVGNLIEASNSISYFYDITLPSATLTTTADAITGETSGRILIDFSEMVTGLEIADIQSSSGTLSNFTGSGNAYSVDVTDLSEGTATITVPVGAASDAAGNGNSEGSVSWVVDLTGPSGFTVNILNPAINDLNEDNFRFRINGAEPRSTFNYTINSTGGGTAVTGTGELNGNGQGGVLDDIDVAGLGDGVLTLSVEMIDEFGNLGAIATDEIQKNTEEESNGIAQGYSPNGDNVDDTWTIPGIEDLPNNVVTIFNRYGTKVWETTNYDNEDNSWDSQSNVDNIFGSAGLPDGTYFYVIEFPGTNTDTKSGFVILKR